MDKFDRLNRQTREYNAYNVDRFNRSAPAYGITEYWLNLHNNAVYRENNGENSNFYTGGKKYDY